MRPWRDIRVIFVLAVVAAVALILVLRASQPPTPTRARALTYKPVSAAAIVAFYLAAQLAARERAHGRGDPARGRAGTTSTRACSSR